LLGDIRPALAGQLAKFRESIDKGLVLPSREAIDNRRARAFLEKAGVVLIAENGGGIGVRLRK